MWFISSEGFGQEVRVCDSLIFYIIMATVKVFPFIISVMRNFRIVSNAWNDKTRLYNCESRNGSWKYAASAFWKMNCLYAKWS